MSRSAKDSKKKKRGQVGDGMETDSQQQNDPTRMTKKPQDMGNETMVQETIKRQNAILEVFLAWIKDNYGISVF